MEKMTIEIIAEISGCHGGNLENAKKLIVEAHIAGATGVKFQCFQPERLAIKRAGHMRLRENYEPTDEGGPTHQLLKLYKQTHTPREWFPELIGFAKEGGLTWHASVFDPDDVAFLETLNCPRYKISSFEAFDSMLIGAVCKTGKPLILSVNQSDDAFPPKYSQMTVLHATYYAVPARAANLVRLRQWAWADKNFPGKQWRWGLSDHTTDHHAGDIAATYGASMIEWHLRLPGVKTPDDAFSWTWQVFSMKTKRIRDIEEILHG